MRRILKTAILFWVVGILFSYWIIRGNGIVFLGKLLELEAKIINVSERILTDQAQSKTLPAWIQKHGRKILKTSNRILQWESEMYERLQARVKHAQAFFTAPYVY